MILTDATEEVQLAVLETMEQDISAVLAHHISHLQRGLRSLAELGDAGVLTRHWPGSHVLPTPLVPPRSRGPGRGHTGERRHLSGR